MRREEAKDFVRNQEPTFLKRAKRNINGRPSYVCPVCGNGSGNDGTGIALDPKDRKHYKCFNCGLYADTISLIGEYFGISDPAAIFEKAYEYYGVIIDENKAGKDSQSNPRTNKPQTAQEAHTDDLREEPEDYTEFIRKAASAGNYSYLMGRGISEKIQRYFSIGYEESWISPAAVQTMLKKGMDPDVLPKTPRCIIPLGKNGYLARDTRDSIPENEKKYAKVKTGKADLFHRRAISKSNIIFVTEGEIDCMSVCECGGCCIGLGSISNKEKFLQYVKEKCSTDRYGFCLMLDNDEPGRRAEEQLYEELKSAGYVTKKVEYSGKDPNTFLMENREEMESTISFLKEEVKGALLLSVQDKEYNAKNLLSYFQNIELRPDGYEAKTGFEELDKKLFGGFHPGLIILGAISSLGKTTFTLQLADQIAAAGNDVIFFSLEMSKMELIAKSLSRHTFLIAGREKENERFIARDTMQILNNRNYKYYSEREKGVITEAIEQYSKRAEHLYIYEGRYNGHRLNVSDIRNIVEAHYKETRRKPFVIIDYLQIMAPADIRMTDKQATDSNVFELKEISRDFSIPVLAISSFNRENYNEPVSMTSFKESGAIEFSSDILFGLQYAGMDRQPKESDKDRAERIRTLMTHIWKNKQEKEPIEIELKCLKNRNGYQFTIPFNMLSAFNYFDEIKENSGFKKCIGSTPFDNMSVPVV